MSTSNFYNVNASHIFSVQIEDTYEYDDLISNLTSEFNSHKDYSNHSKSDPNDLRSYPSTSIGGFSNAVMIGEDEVEVWVTPVVRSGYYDGVNLDWHIRYYVNGYEDDFYEHYEDTNIQSLVYEYVDFIENVFSQYSQPLGVTAQFSNGETIYHPINFKTRKMITRKLNILGKFENLELFDSKGNIVYQFVTKSNGGWYKHTYNSNGKLLIAENSDGVWSKRTYDSNGNDLTYENSDGFWSKRTYDSDGNELTFEDSCGVRRGFDIPEFTMEQLVEKIGHDFKIIK